MNGSNREFVVHTRNNPRGLILVPFTVGDLYELPLVLNTGYVVSCISAGVRDVLSALGYLQQTGRSSYLLGDLSVGGQAVAALEVRVNRAVALIGVEGILGLNFLADHRGEVSFQCHTPPNVGSLTLP